jgi:hypothetical protein
MNSFKFKSLCAVLFFFLISCAPISTYRQIPEDQMVKQYFQDYRVATRLKLPDDKAYELELKQNAIKKGFELIREIDNILIEAQKQVDQDKNTKKWVIAGGAFIAAGGQIFVPLNPGDVGKNIGAIAALLGSATVLITDFIPITEGRETCISQVSAEEKTYLNAIGDDKLDSEKLESLVDVLAISARRAITPELCKDIVDKIDPLIKKYFSSSSPPKL